MFGDQHDNSTRIEETGMGRSLKTFECTVSQLEEAINSILNDKKLIQKWKNASLCIRKDNGTDAVVNEMLKYLENKGEIKN